MASRPAEAAPESGYSRLNVSLAAPVSRPRAAAILGDERASWLGDAQPDGRWLLDLELPLGEALSSVRFKKAAYVQLGQLQATPGQPLRAEISWQAAGLAPLFPVFAGNLVWDAGELRLRGVYAPPGGGVGLLADRLLFNVAARGTARWLLRRVAAAMRG